MRRSEKQCSGAEQSKPVVDQLGQLLEANLRRALAEHEQKRVDDVGFATAVGTNHRREALVKQANSRVNKI